MEGSNNIVETSSRSSSSKKRENEQEDRISNLPDSVIVHILSLLPTVDAVKTVLIPRFGHLWTFMHSLDFDWCSYHDCSEEIDYDDDRFVNLVRHVLVLHECSPIFKFRLCLEFNSVEDPEAQDLVIKKWRSANEIDTWIYFAVRRRVKVLDVDFKGCGSFEPECYYILPNFVLSSDSLTELRLVNCCWRPRGRIHMRSLKTLSLVMIKLTDDTIKEILAGCPLLEDLSIGCHGLNKLNLTSPYLKKLMVFLGAYETSMVEISCPNVMSLNISGWIERADLKNLSSLVDAALNFSYKFKCTRAEFRGVRVLLEKLHYAKVFTACTWSILVLTIWELANMSCPSSNWKCLFLNTMLTKWHLPGIASLLRNSPSLEMLIIDVLPGTSAIPTTDGMWLGSYDFDGENYWSL